MKKAIFIGKSSIDYMSIYKETAVQKISQYTQLDTQVLSKEELSEYNTTDVAYIFSSWGMPSFTEDEIKSYFPNLKAVFYAAGSVQGFAREFLRCGVKVFSAWQANAVPVAEYTVSQIILANKGFYQSSTLCKREEREKALEYCSHFTGNYSAKIGILGAGMIGKNVISLLKPFSLEVYVFDPFLPQQKADELGVRLTDLEDIFSSCDVISNHLANNKNTVGMLNYQHFSCMKDYAVFINTGRGAQVAENDLVRALREKPTKTAVLDVTMPEPPEAGHDFYTMENVFLTPHIAGSMNNEVQRMGAYMADEFCRYFNHQETKYQVTVKMLETMA